jgi:hypothetical protein
MNRAVDPHPEGEVHPQREPGQRTARPMSAAKLIATCGREGKTQWMTRAIRPGRGFVAFEAIALPSEERIRRSLSGQAGPAPE